jgi:hypothetical protein
MASKMFLTFDTQQKIVLAHNKDNIYKEYMSESKRVSKSCLN